MPNLYIIKLGGSVITAKEKNEFVVQEETLKRLAIEIKQGTGKNRLILIHGAGPFGHTNVSEYGINNGVFSEKQKEGLEKTIKDCNFLDSKVVEKLKEVGINAVGLDPNKLVVQENKKIVQFNTEPIEKALEEGRVPVLYGQMVPDQKLNASVVSGDAILGFLAKKFKPAKIILGTDVDGIFTADPKTNSNAKKIPHINKKNFKQILANAEEAKTVDVTGGMKGKLEKLEKTVQGIPTVVLNANEPKNLLKALKGEEIGTKIKL